MPLELLYWILMLLWLVSGFWFGYSQPVPSRGPLIGWSLGLFLLFLVIGLKLFGAPIKG